MTKTAFVPLKSCTGCEHFDTETVPCADSFCRPEKWLCGHEDVDKDDNIIDGYHDLMGKDPGIPNFCPFLSEDQREKEPEYEEVIFTKKEIAEWITEKLNSIGLVLVSEEEFVDDEGKFGSLVCKCIKK